MSIELAELRAEWERIARENEGKRDRDGFLTTVEFSEVWGVGKDKARRILADFESLGRLESRTVTERVLGGMMGHKKAYRVLPEKGRTK